MKYYIGLDAHSTTCTFAVVDINGECKLRKTVDTTEKNLHWVIDQIHGETELTLEESTLSQWLYLILRDKVDRLLICNPLYIAKKQGAKTDFRDALHLAQELRTNHLSEVHHESSHWIELQGKGEKYSKRLAFLKMKLVVKNKQSFLMSTGFK